jgi:hypothetical protein
MFVDMQDIGFCMFVAGCRDGIGWDEEIIMQTLIKEWSELEQEYKDRWTKDAIRVLSALQRVNQ